jgi:hypothetical protein
MLVEPNKYNKYNTELVGIIEFNYPQSLNWIQQNICFHADFGILTSPNVCIYNFENNIQRNNIAFQDEINDGWFLLFLEFLW